MIDNETLREAGDAIRTLRFMQANAIVGMRLQGRAHKEAKDYMNKLADLQTKLENAALEMEE